MLRTYKATIKNNYIEWDNNRNEIINSDSPVPVYITILDESEPENITDRGRSMVSALNMLVKLHAYEDVNDPVELIRSIRKERNLPGREDAD